MQATFLHRKFTINDIVPDRGPGSDGDEGGR